ncbi:MAG: AmmeMemoRadiSam system protein B [Chloroflexi bacterium]|nr:AmmeMemoRadiSam system protein B [Chloroflexota bacterium]
MSAVSQVRPSPIAGTWYDGNPQALALAVDGYISAARLPELPGEVLAVIAPHAGHRYSGAVAGYAFAAVKGSSPARVVVLAPMHHLYPYEFITTAHAAYATPLGEIPVDRAFINDLDQNLKARLGYGLNAVANDPEHSLEIELPFLQRALVSNFSIGPVMLRQQARGSARHMGEALAETVAGRPALLVASSDLSHFHNQAAAMALDASMLAQVEAFSPDGIFDLEEKGGGEACGYAALAAVLWAAKALGADTVRLLNYATSGDVTGDYQRVVGYGAAVVLKTR